MDLHVKCKPIKLLEGNIREHLHDLGYDDACIDSTAKRRSVKNNF